MKVVAKAYRQIKRFSYRTVFCNNYTKYVHFHTGNLAPIPLLKRITCHILQFSHAIMGNNYIIHIRKSFVKTFLGK